LDRSYADEEEEKLGQDFCLIVNLDLALVYLRVNKPKKTCIYCRDALYIKKDHPKALYRWVKLVIIILPPDAIIFF
jgi:hypothetical protein